MKVSDIKNWFQGNLYYILEKYNLTANKDILKLAEERANKCPECLEAGNCLACGCKTPEMFFAPNKKCEKGRW